MDKYRKAFFVLASAASMLPGLSLIFSIVGLKLSGVGIVGSFPIAWWGLYFYLRTESKTAFWFSFVLVNLYWWPLLVRSVRRIIYGIKNDNINLIYGYGEPSTFLYHAVYETIFLILLAITFIFGVAVIINYLKEKKDSS
jgi:hypothetical protein